MLTPESRGDGGLQPAQGFSLAYRRIESPQPLADARGSEPAACAHGHLPSRDRKGVGSGRIFPHPLQPAQGFSLAGRRAALKRDAD
jgi:hypothetical protein